MRLEPAAPEARAGRARRAYRRGHDGKHEIRDPVADAAGTPEGQHDELVCVVCRDEAGDVGFDAVFEFGEGVGAGGLDAWAVSLRAGHFCVWGVVVAETVGGGGVLGEEFELGEEGGGYGCRGMLVWICVREKGGIFTSTCEVNGRGGYRVNCTEQDD